MSLESGSDCAPCIMGTSVSASCDASASSALLLVAKFG